MFRGNYTHNLNTQGRVSLPARFRQVLEERYSPRMVLVGLPGWIDAFPEESYRRKEEELLALPEDDPRMSEFLAVSRQNLWEVEIDGQGRILLPPQLRDELGLKREVVFIGFPDRIRIFEPQQWSAYIQQAKQNHQENSLLVARLKSRPREG